MKVCGHSRITDQAGTLKDQVMVKQMKLTRKVGNHLQIRKNTILRKQRASGWLRMQKLLKNIGKYYGRKCVQVYFILLSAMFSSVRWIFLSEITKAHHQDEAWFHQDATAADFYAISGLLIRCIQDHAHVQSHTAQNS